MVQHRNDLTADYVRSILDYNPETGILTWKNCPSYRVRSGRRAGCRYPNGYIYVEINGSYLKHRRYRAHHLAWLIMTGEWAPQIDHIDRNPSNNRWNNLRLATQQQNCMNKSRQSNNTNGFPGVTLYKPTGRWAARIWRNRKRISLGYFATAEEAYAVRCAAAQELYGEFYPS